jgi:fructokinase
VLGAGGEALWESRVPTPRDDYHGTLDAIASLVEAGDQHGGPCSVGIGMPGAISPATGLVKNANSTWLNDRPLHADLERRLGRPVRLANDANCLAVSEATDGAAAGAHLVFGVILGTGTGGGIAIDGRALIGRNAIAGEWGHNPLPAPTPEELPGPPCYCGRRGCIETFLSGPGLSADYERRAGVRIASEAVVSAADRGEPAAIDAMTAWTQRLARALGSIVNVLDPDVIVVGGGLSRLRRIYDDVPRVWESWIFSDRVTTPLVPARFGDASGVRGAAWLWNG